MNQIENAAVKLTWLRQTNLLSVFIARIRSKTAREGPRLNNKAAIELSEWAGPGSGRGDGGVGE